MRPRLRADLSRAAPSRRGRLCDELARSDSGHEDPSLLEPMRAGGREARGAAARFRDGEGAGDGTLVGDELSSLGFISPQGSHVFT